MIAVRLLPRKEVESELTKAGCTRFSTDGPQEETWVTPWKFYFTVTYFGPDDWCTKYMLFEILADVERTRP